MTTPKKVRVRNLKTHTLFRLKLALILGTEIRDGKSRIFPIFALKSFDFARFGRD